MGAAVPLQRHKISVEAYHQMGKAGILAENDRVELIDGDLINMAPIGSVHASVVNTLNDFFVRQVGIHGIVSVQNSLNLQPDSEPQPDLMVLKPRADRYRNALPIAGDVLLLIEVADTTADYDRKIKVPLYARHGVAEVWLIDLAARQLEIYREPHPAGFRTLLRRGPEDRVAPGQIAMAELPLSEIWPAA
ncbi:MAG: Uma2 family endonuclease [Nevskia sp.]|nr:Uma2 family endonuclease [Nevskia sp.]